MEHEARPPARFSSLRSRQTEPELHHLKTTENWSRQWGVPHTITRQNDTAIIEYKDPTYGTTHLTIGPELEMMTDQEIVNLYNDMLRGQAELAAQWKHVVVEVPLGSPQIEFSKQCQQWSPRGSLLRCLIMDKEVEGEMEPVITIDNEELTWSEFGRLICTYAGWGMRIEFVADDRIHRRPKLEVREPEK